MHNTNVVNYSFLPTTQFDEACDSNYMADISAEYSSPPGCYPCIQKTYSLIKKP